MLELLGWLLQTGALATPFLIPLAVLMFIKRPKFRFTWRSQQLFVLLFFRDVRIFAPAFCCACVCHPKWRGRILRRLLGFTPYAHHVVLCGLHGPGALLCRLVTGDQLGATTSIEPQTRRHQAHSKRTPRERPSG